jgi:hypothetical protein
MVISPCGNEASLRIIQRNSTDEPESPSWDILSIDRSLVQPSVLNALELVMAWKHGSCPGRLPAVLNQDLPWQSYELLIRSE